MRLRGVLLVTLAGVAVWGSMHVLNDSNSETANDVAEREAPSASQEPAASPTLRVNPDAPQVGENVDLDAGDHSGSVAGLVVNAFGEQLRGARVEAIHVGDEFSVRGGSDALDDPHAETTTDREGEFVVATGAHDAVCLRIGAPGYARTCFGPFRAGSQHRLELTRPQALHVSVVDPDRKPVPGAVVTAFGWTSNYLWFRETGTTDPAGDIVFARIPAARLYSVRLHTIRPGWATAVRRPRRLQRRGVTKHTIRLQEAITRNGTVRNKETGEPIAGARVSISRFAPSEDRYVVSDAEGSFAIDTWPSKSRGLVSVVVQAPGYVGTRVHVISEGEATDANNIDIALEPGQRLTGRVVAPNGTPVPNVIVHANNKGVIVGRPGRSHASLSYERTQTDAEGQFAFTSLPFNRPHRIHISAQEFARLEVRVSRSDDASIDMGDVSLVKGRTLTGVLVSKSGSPIANASLSLRDANEPPPRPFQSRNAWFCASGGFTTDAQGRFQIGGIGPGEHVLTAVLAEVRQVTSDYHEVHVSDSTEETHVRLVSKTFRNVTIRVVSDDDRAVPETTVVIPGSGRTPLFKRQTNAKGVVTFLATPAMTKVEISPPKDASFAPVRPRTLGIDETDVTVVLHAAATTSGTALDSAGKPVAQAAITIEKDGKRVRSVFTKNDGTFSIALPREDVVDLLLVKEYRAHDDRETLYAEARAVQAGSKNIVLRAKQQETDQGLTVRVLSPTGDPVANVPIRLHPSPKAKQTSWRTNSNGEVTFTDLPSIPTRVEAFYYTTVARPWCAPDPITAVPGDQTINLDLVSGQRIQGNVLDANDKPVTSGVLYINHAGRLVSSSRVNHKGEFVIAVNKSINGELSIRYVSDGKSTIVKTTPNVGTLTVRLP